MAQIKLTYTDDQGQTNQVLVDINMDPDSVDQWFLDNLGYIPKDVIGEVQ